MVRNNDREILLRHEKCNLGPLQEELRVEFDSSSKTFKRFGTIPGQAAAATLVRNAQRAAILKLIKRAADQGVHMSTKVNAPTNAYVALRDDPEYPGSLDRKAFFAMLRDLEGEQLVHMEPYKKGNRGIGYRLVLTEQGQTRVALGSGAAPAWKQREEA